LEKLGATRSIIYKRNANAGKELHLIEGGASAEPSDPVRL
jgi:hypothetical protein